MLDNFQLSQNGSKYYSLLNFIVTQFNNCKDTNSTQSFEMSKYYLVALSHLKNSIIDIFDNSVSDSEYNTTYVYGYIFKLSYDNLKTYYLSIIHGFGYSVYLLDIAIQESKSIIFNTITLTASLLVLFYIIIIVLLLILNSKIKENSELEKGLIYFNSTFHNGENFLLKKSQEDDQKYN